MEKYGAGVLICSTLRIPVPTIPGKSQLPVPYAIRPASTVLP